MVTLVSIRIALTRIGEAACGVPVERVSVVIPRSIYPRIYIASVPSEHRAQVYHYLAERLDLKVPLGGDPLVLTVPEAEALQTHALGLPTAGAAT